MITQRFPLARLLIAIPLFVILVATNLVIVATGQPAGAIGPSLIALAGGGISLAIYAAYVRRIERRGLVELAPRGALGELGRGALVGLGLYVATVAALLSAGGDVTLDGGGAALGPWLVWVTGTVVAEEVLFRGVLFRMLEARFSAWVALAVSAALFGGLHASNAGTSVISTVAIALEAGVLLGAAYLASRRLWLPIALHAGWNFAQAGLLGVERAGHAAPGVWHTRVASDAFGPESSLVAVALCLAAAVALLALAHRRGHLHR